MSALKRILMVDDNSELVTLIKEILTVHLIVEVTEHDEWTEAITEIEASPTGYFNLVITDLRMPRGREGYAVIDAVRKCSKEIKIILTSSDCSPLELEQCSPDKFILKPFKNEQLVSIIQELIPGIEPAK